MIKRVTRTAYLKIGKEEMLSITKNVGTALIVERNGKTIIAVLHTGNDPH